MAVQLEFPGFFDIQVNGFAGVDFNAPSVTEDRIRGAIAALRATGVTRFLPTLITGSLESVTRCARTIGRIDDPAIAGIHLEGPYISPEDGFRGAHPRAHCLAASKDDFARRQEAAGGRIALVTLAPEVPGALDLIEHLVDGGIRVALGHTNASGAVIGDAVRAGATLSTHLGNGCAAVLPRHPNIIWEQLARDELWTSIISDGHHLPGCAVKVITRVKSPERTILVTDAIAAAGCPPGSYRIGEADVEVSADRRASLRGTPFLAGSALTLPEAVGHAVRFTGLDVREVLRMAAEVPAGYMDVPLSGRVSAEWDEVNSRLTIVDVT
jgi:N-acetylglucosamine-6-phosphate deacetylase